MNYELNRSGDIMNFKKWFFKHHKEQNPKNNKAEVDDNLFDLLKQLRGSNDFKEVVIKDGIKKVKLFYFHSLVDRKILHRDIIPYIKKEQVNSVEDVREVVPSENIETTSDVNKIQNQILSGSCMVQVGENSQSVALMRAKINKNRNVSIPEVEFSVVGPKEAFVESLDTNLNLIRKRLPIPELRIEEMTVGKITKSKVAILSIEGITNEENVNTLRERLQSIEVDSIIDSSYIVQLISDNQNSPFPQLIDTERPDRVAAILTEGKVAFLVDGAPHAIIAPTTLVEFFSAFEDYFLNWITASFFRLVRLFGVFFSILVTPLYVAVLTYHYELIPKDLLGILVTSRREIPLPPILEAIFLELAIELLREAGARLPTKVGQTIGIVGGIVIGTASVEAGLTSNVLLIFVALAALASFTTPVYQIGNTIRLIRFPFLFSAHLWGLLGVSICFCFFMGHLLRLTSLGRPFLEPIYPPRVKDFKDAFIRLPWTFQSQRPVEVQAQDTMRFNKKKAKEKKEIDE
ncbi:spore germination protein [Aquisalibacillus elongatus]|uniref:GerA spore germination protein n=1 Tax=Aquisalibacillus elongatus TaxID=485577 RepID=A0A3N5BQU4_9BACI|nr:spore germination protein [Aquisalibacillus elongatus]RPF52148.1 GerA spore germination protein [Aquisalibacillus elongatus]